MRVIGTYPGHFELLSGRRFQYDIASARRNSAAAHLGGETGGDKRGRGAERKTPFVAAAQVSADEHPERLRLSPVADFRKRALQAGTVVRSEGWIVSGACRRLAANTKRRSPEAARAAAGRQG